MNRQLSLLFIIFYAVFSNAFTHQFISRSVITKRNMSKSFFELSEFAVVGEL